MHKLGWSDAVQRCEHAGEAYALVTILGCSGSTPRDVASKMVVTAEATYDTIGGGNLEFTVTKVAREKIAQNATSAEIIPFPLGGALGQCCGGNATVLIEVFAGCALPVALFGAGHVAKALTTILAGLPYRVHWVDSRAELFPNTLPPNIQKICCKSPVEYIKRLPVGTAMIIMTHDHPLDYALVEAALRQCEGNEHWFSSIGVIGSETKAQRFRARLIEGGFTQAQINRVTCPIGLSAIPGKLPMEVAVSVAAQLINVHHAIQTAEHSGQSAPKSMQKTKQKTQQKNKRQGLVWTEIKKMLDHH